MSLWKKMKSNSESTVTLLEPKWKQTAEASEIMPGHKLDVPTRGNQKLGDKVTTLQKLVSPFGKTDTASVLHEASLYIKLLHEQIQKQTLFQMLSFSCTTVNAPYNQVNLRRRGLCLVPMSITQLVTMEEQNNYASTSRKIILPTNF
ncbi:hypothetical protein RIF29_14096 [Crotalaria pallida]|uniref:BHLH domain-containing protein n=1 Tax=Crotalaria pallida TaxID=3830 RepID=A0AAN9FCT0_CROPI